MSSIQNFARPVFAALLGSYVVLRFGAAVWPKPHHVHLSEPIGAFNTFVLICSSVTIVLALEAARAAKNMISVDRNSHMMSLPRDRGSPG
ncbi:MAG: hypothetical protein ACKONH_04755 [Planctomycetia bacterium]